MQLFLDSIGYDYLSRELWDFMIDRVEAIMNEHGLLVDGRLPFRTLEDLVSVDREEVFEVWDKVRFELRDYRQKQYPDETQIYKLLVASDIMYQLSHNWLKYHPSEVV